MAIPNWRDTSGDWFHRTPLVGTCSKLHDLTLNEDALVQQETAWSDIFYTVPAFQSMPHGSWVAVAAVGMTLLGNEPYDLLKMYLVWTWYSDQVPANLVKLRVYNVQRNEYYPSSAGWTSGNSWPAFTTRQNRIEDVSLVPGGTPWTTRSYEFRVECYMNFDPAVGTQGGALAEWVGILTRE